MRDRHGLGPEAPLSPKGWVVLVWVQQTCCQPMSDGVPASMRGPAALAISVMDGLREGAVLLPVRIHTQRCSAEPSGRRYLAVEPVLFMS